MSLTPTLDHPANAPPGLAPLPASPPGTALLAHFDADTLCCSFASAAFAHWAGLEGAAAAAGRTLAQLAGTTLWAQLAPALHQALAGHEAQLRHEDTGADGQPRVLDIHLLPQPGAGFFMLLHDAALRLQAERAAQASEERLQRFSAASGEGISFHHDGIISDCNDALLRLTGYTREEVLGRHMLDFVHPHDQQSVRDYMAQGREDPYEVGIVCKDAQVLALEVVGKTLPRAAGGSRVVVVRDTSARKQAQQRAEFLTLHDALTQLPNRRHLMQQLGQLLAAPQRPPLALLFFDLDHFRTVNDSLGHEAGDQLLCEVARRLQDGAAPGEGFVARVGGDQFVALLPVPRGRAQAAHEAQALLARLRAPLSIGGTPLPVSPSLGISLSPQDGDSADELLRRAAIALRRAKDDQRGSWAFYTAGMEGAPAALLRDEHLLRQALVQQSFVLHYQPQVEVASGRLCGFEALVRWQHPERGLVGPADFIPLAESRGLIAAIDHWVLREACCQASAWHAAGLPRVPVAVNLSAIEFRQRDVAQDIAQVLRECRLSPRYLEVEITESALMLDAGQARATLSRLQALGVSVAIDDFGTGYSSLAYLKRYPLDKIKVDRSFVMDTPGDSDDVAIVTAVVQLARSLQLRSVAEGVETEAQLQLLRRLGCDLAQGYGISRPLTAAQAEAWMRERSR